MMKSLTFLKPYRLTMGAAIFFLLVELIVELYQPYILSKIIDKGILNNDLSYVTKWGLVMLVLSVVAFIGGVLNTFYSTHVSQSFAFGLRKSLFEKVQTFSFTTFNFLPTSSLITRLTNDVTQLQNTVFMSLRIILRAPLMVVGSVVMALILDWKLSFVLFFILPLLFFFLNWMVQKGRELFKRVQENVDSVNSVLRENLMGMKLIKAFVRNDFEDERFQVINNNLKRKTATALKTMEVTMPVLLLFMNASILVVLWYGNSKVHSNQSNIGEIVAIVNYISRITSTFSVFSFIIMAFSRARASSERIEEVLTIEEDFIEKNEGNKLRNRIEGKVQFHDVSFQYPNTENDVLQDISFVAYPKTSIAILGSTGAGKTSLFQLIPRLYDVSEGTILIDDQDIRKMNSKELRGQIGYVPQEALLFTGTIKENLLMGRENASDEDVYTAAKHAQIHETILSFPNGYESKIGQKGVNLSGGQKQRLAIARALLRKPSILLLDDSTSALDLKTEAKLIQSLKEYDCTIFIITQKISSAINADKILIIDDGCLVEEGTHDSLLESSKLYKAIYYSQYGREEIPNAKGAN
ncbi:ABC transporter ATP-binding protein [Gottfriedia solisilvae]|uniref:Putative ABC transporter ATP-binding protein YfiB n=1 Tax=Gottfriedia solisilvae TaxID=1516104 RepID=A0A8J3EYH9_9BACI|nr:ABC transporter ATP-binding protein [Gottfriedia solisilvae]GGI13321.1 putative ABC transporter ATP-binding protein YfiB [Gottfriedia solisilvae]